MKKEKEKKLTLKKKLIVTKCRITAVFTNTNVLEPPACFYLILNDVSHASCHWIHRKKRRRYVGIFKFAKTTSRFSVVLTAVPATAANLSCCSGNW